MPRTALVLDNAYGVTRHGDDRGRARGMSCFQPGTAAPFTPLSLPGLQLWLDATQQAEGNGVAVPTFTDRSGNGRHLTQATATKQPFMQFNGMAAGKKALIFDGVDDVLQSAAVTLNAPSSYSLFVVAKSFVDKPAAYLFDYTVVPPGGTMIRVVEHTANTIICGRPNAATALSAKTLNTAWLAAGIRRIRVEYNGTHASHVLYLENVLQVTPDGVGTADPGTGATSSGVFNLANRNDELGTPFKGWVAEVLLCSPKLSAANTTAVEAYLSARWT